MGTNDAAAAEAEASPIDCRLSAAASAGTGGEAAADVATSPAGCHSSSAARGGVGTDAARVGDAASPIDWRLSAAASAGTGGDCAVVCIDPRHKHWKMKCTRKQQRYVEESKNVLRRDQIKNKDENTFKGAQDT